MISQRSSDWRSVTILEIETGLLNRETKTTDGSKTLE